MPARSNKENFISKSILAHGDRYNYSKVEYVNNQIKVLIICPNHGEFWQRPRSHTAEAKGCFECGVSERFLTTEEFITRAKKVHSNYYSYERSVYTHSHNEIIINCPNHSYMKINASLHLRGIGCSQCLTTLNTQFNLEKFIKKCQETHNFKYNYDNVKFLGMKENVEITCPYHLTFYQKAQHHADGSGCPSCRSTSSAQENLWLDTLDIPLEMRQKEIIINNKCFRLDAVDKKNKIIYEYYGDYWHGNPDKFDSNAINPTCKKSYGELYLNTLKKEELLVAAGYKVISIWEKDFKKSLNKK